MIEKTSEPKAERVIAAKPQTNEEQFDLTLRPRTLKEYIGQEKNKEHLKIFLAAAKKRKQPIEHVLLYGPPGLGKTTLAYVLANEMGVTIKMTSGPAIERAGDLASLLTNLQNNDILFIDEIHRLPKVVEEILYPAMEDFAFDIVLGKGPGARSVRLDLPRFTIIGATTRIGLLSGPLRDRFGSTVRLDFYQDDEIEKIVNRSAKILGIETETEAAREIAKRARKTPRIANRLLRRVRDFAEVKSDGRITLDIASSALDMLEVDSLGLDRNDRMILRALIEKFQGGPVGINSLAAATSEEEQTIADIYEPYLMRLGFLDRTPKGRMATALAYEHLGISLNKPQINQLI
ncbi:MAG: Holliday junction DNA helicase RuvB [Candidatus Doudnabacteria bacterium RIFCSPHIGHO2_01_FULL_49_9]|uniref:Holliday junction branch migration complex subunit RuvB n=1 Tax=Candidatus Doudnabacteria bacterium RIFCSPHIGHO2_01_FULL_49_9 TaxID=1817827 RepID=A0A1F5P3A8_9BACT|nr:MAG: Holliday junction DNA helicase RuvB [Candidatus Doudnabacteria bacterium RIFCSPHIGHO2_01_FULL_49_9]